MKQPSVRRQRILDAACEEIAEHGPAGLRLKRVASAAGTSLHGIYFYFNDRDGLIAAAVAHRANDTFATYIQSPPDLLFNVTTKQGVLDVLAPFLQDTTSRERRQMRDEIVQAAATSLHNNALAREFSPMREEACGRMVSLAETLANQNLLAPGVTPVTWSRFWLSVLFGQVMYDTVPCLMVDNDEWSDFLLSMAGLMLQDATNN